MAILGLLAAACSSNKTPSGTPSSGAAGAKGGTFRIEADAFPWEDSGNGFDPVSEYVGTNWMIFRSLLLRPLMGYNYRRASEGGNNVVPDLATAPGEYSADHKSVTYTMKKGVKFGNPVKREITAKDIEYAFERLATPALDSGGYQGYYREFVKGFEDFEKKKSDSISGIEIPADDPYKITFTFVKPAYDWDFRMAMPASAPVPREVAGCFKKALEYGQYVVSSGPYEFDGMDQLKFQPCKSIKPVSGMDFAKKMTLVRNPSYDAATDSKSIREALPDSFVFTKNTNSKDIFQRIQRNQVDWTPSAVTGDVLQKYTTNSSLKPFLHAGVDQENVTWYITMNLTEPPFDDIHVRKAANFVMDKKALLTAVGGTLKGTIAEHTIPPGLLNGKLDPGAFDPYATTDHAGDVEKAKAEMKLSKYDKNKDGLCDPDLCYKGNDKFVRNVTRNVPPFGDMYPIIEDSFSKIGIKVKTTEVASYYGEIGQPAKKIELGSGGGWGPDWPDPLTFMLVPMAGKSIGPAGNINTALLGLTKEQAKTLKADFPSVGVPSVDADVDHCGSLAGEERSTCYADLDKKIMNDMVPWVPLRWATQTSVVSAAVLGYDYDQASAEDSLAHVAIDPSKQV